MKKFVKNFALIGVFCFLILKANAQLNVSISIEAVPPAMPVYEQPECPTDGYLWQPGYWAYDANDGYYWVPGVWVAPPQPGYLWTPGYWRFERGLYSFHQGYWGEHVGFYGGVNYGYGYSGVGFYGGGWQGGHFRYNTAVVRVNTTVVRNVYVDRTVIVNVNVNNHTSFNGPGGITARPRPEEQAAMKERHIQPTHEQLSHQQVASKDKSQFASVNKGHPAAAAMNKVGGRPFNEHGQEAKKSTPGNNKPNQVKKPGGNGNNPKPNGEKPVNKAQNPQPNKQPGQQQQRMQQQQKHNQQQRGQQKEQHPDKPKEN